MALVLAYQCGLRHDEIVSGLRVRDVLTQSEQGDSSMVDVRAHGGWTPKAHAERRVPVPETAIDEIASYVFMEHEFRDDPDAPFLYWGVTKPRRYTDLYVPVRAAFKEAGLYDPEDKPGLHMLRRSFASHLLSGGTDLQTVMAFGGWSTIEAVQRYLATTDDLMRRASGLLEVE